MCIDENVIESLQPLSVIVKLMLSTVNEVQPNIRSEFERIKAFKSFDKLKNGG